MVSGCVDEERMTAHLSLKALRMRSTSTSRWNAFASRLSSLSISASAGGLFVEEDEARSAMACRSSGGNLEVSSKE